METTTTTKTLRLAKAAAFTAISFAPAWVASLFGAPLLAIVLFAYASGVLSSLVIWTAADGL